MTDEDIPQARWLRLALPGAAAALTAAGLASAILRRGDERFSWEGWALPAVMAFIIVIGGRQWPRATVAVSVLVLLAHYVTNRPVIGFALLLVPALINAAERGALRAAAVIGSGAIVATYVMRTAVLEQSLAILGVQLLTEIGLVVGALLAGDALRSRSGWRAESRRRHELETAAAQRIATQRIDAERSRLSRDIHDAMGHTLVVLSQQSNLALATLDSDPAKARAALESIRSSVRSARGEIDDALSMLRGPADEQRTTPTLGDLDTLAETLAAQGIRATVSVVGVPEGIGAAAEATAYRIIREATTNVIRHSAASRVEISVDAGGEALRLRVVDDGGVSTDWKPGDGISGMRERAALVGGQLEITAGVDSFVVAATIPARRSA